MPTGLRLRAACQVCHSRGQYRPIELFMRDQDVIRWHKLVLCAACRSSWMDMTFGQHHFRSDVSREDLPSPFPTRRRARRRRTLPAT